MILLLSFLLDYRSQEEIGGQGDTQVRK